MALSNEVEIFCEGGVISLHVFLEIVEWESCILATIEFYQRTVGLHWAIHFIGRKSSKNLGISRVFLVLVGVATVRLDNHVEILVRTVLGIHVPIDLNVRWEGTVSTSKTCFKDGLFISSSDVLGSTAPTRVVPPEVEVRIFYLWLQAFRVLVDHKVSSVNDRDLLLATIRFNLHSIGSSID